MSVLAAATDLILASVCALSAWHLAQHSDALRRYASVGMALTAFAAGLGTMRFAGVDGLIPMHEAASRLAGAISPGCFALVAWTLSAHGRRWHIEVGLALLLMGWATFVIAIPVEGYRLVVGTAAVAAMVAILPRERGLAALSLAMGALGLGAAALLIGTEGSWGPVDAIGAFHMTLAVSHGLIALGLSRV